MRANHLARLALVAVSVNVIRLFAAQEPAILLGTTSLTASGDLSAQMVQGIDRWLERENGRVYTNRTRLWSGARDDPFRATMIKRLREVIGAVDERVPEPRLEFLAQGLAAEVFRTNGPMGFAVHRVRWPVLEGVHGEGLLLEPLRAGPPRGRPIGLAIALPDADQTPESIAGLAPGVPAESQFARHLVESGWRVLVPVLVSRDDQFSGNPRLKRFTNQPHREWIYRQAYEMGRHVIGFEVERILAGVEALRHFESNGQPRVGLIGYGEGGLVALHAAVLEPEAVGAVAVSGYFGPREQLWQQPIYRNLFAYLRDFGDAELAALIAPRRVLIEYAAPPGVQGPPAPRPGRSGAAPGRLDRIEFADVEAEVDRARSLAGPRNRSFIEIIHGSEGMPVSFGSRKTLAQFARALGVTNAVQFKAEWAIATNVLPTLAVPRQERAVRELESFTQTLLRRSAATRERRIWASGNTNDFFARAERNRAFFSSNVMGQIDSPRLPAHARSRAIYDEPKWRGHEVMLDVLPDVFAWGYLLVPKDLKPGERRPVVVCQHGLEGLPEDTVTLDPKHKGFVAYKGFAARLAERGFIVYAPHNPYRGQDKFRVLQRKANPLGLSLFSFIIAQHDATTDWLVSLPFVDPERMAFYGLSYGGKTAMRVPAVNKRYALSICSADFNEWVQKNVTTESPYSYMFTGEYEMPEWDLGHTFNYAEMASLIAPRPFMVERGHDDGVAPDSWVAYEFAKIRRMYAKLGLSDRTEIEFFNGPHTIHGVGTFSFLHRHLNWPEPK